MDERALWRADQDFAPSTWKTRSPRKNPVYPISEKLFQSRAVLTIKTIVALVASEPCHEIDSLRNAGNTLCSRDLRSDSIGGCMGCCRGYTLEGEKCWPTATARSERRLSSRLTPLLAKSGG